MLRVRVLPGLYIDERPAAGCPFTIASDGAIQSSKVVILFDPVFWVAQGRSRLQGACMKKLIQFFKDSVGELKKVVWPNKDSVIASTKVVLVSTLLVAAFLGIVDFLLVRGIDLLF
jgi:preprotein translocase subunit SecE